MHCLMGLMVCSLCPIAVCFETAVGCSRCEHLLDSPATNEYTAGSKKQSTYKRAFQMYFFVINTNWFDITLNLLKAALSKFILF